MFAIAGAWGCGPAPFEGSADSLESLAEHVLDGLAQQDFTALEEVRLTEFEHNEVVWPELPVSAPEVNFPVDFAWSNIETRNQSALARVDQFYEGLDMELERIDCRGDTQGFETFEVMTDCWVTFETPETGERFEARVFKDVLVRNGGYKIFRYYDEEPEPLPEAQAP
jgi:hypothetical protein